MTKYRELTADLRDRANDVRESVKDLASSARAAAGYTVEHLRDSAASGLRRSTRKVATVEQSFAQHIREEPLTSVLVALGFGVLLGCLWRHD